MKVYVLERERHETGGIVHETRDCQTLRRSRVVGMWSKTAGKLGKVPCLKCWPGYRIYRISGPL